MLDLFNGYAKVLAEFSLQHPEETITLSSSQEDGDVKLILSFTKGEETITHSMIIRDEWIGTPLYSELIDNLDERIIRFIEEQME